MPSFASPLPSDNVITPAGRRPREWTKIGLALAPGALVVGGGHVPRIVDLFRAEGADIGCKLAGDAGTCHELVVPSRLHALASDELASVSGSVHSTPTVGVRGDLVVFGGVVWRKAGRGQSVRAQFEIGIRGKFGRSRVGDRRMQGGTARIAGGQRRHDGIGIRATAGVSPQGLRDAQRTRVSEDAARRTKGLAVDPARRSVGALGRERLRKPLPKEEVTGGEGAPQSRPFLSAGSKRVAAIS